MIFSYLWQNPDAEAGKSIFLCSLKFSLTSIPSEDHLRDISLNKCSTVLTELLVPLILLKISWEQVLIQKQGFGNEKDGHCGKLIGSNLVIFSYKEFEKFRLCKSMSQSEVLFIVYFEPIESGHVKINFSYWQRIQNVNTERAE